MSRRKRSAAPPREPRNKSRAAAPPSDVADLEAAAEMLEAAVIRETEAMREEEAMRQAEESLAAILDSDLADVTRVDDGDALEAEAHSAARNPADADANADALPVAIASGEEDAVGTVEDANVADATPAFPVAVDDENATDSQAAEDFPEEPVETRDPYAVFAEYERRSFAHVVASADQVQAPGLWRGIAFRIGTRRLMASITEVSEILPVLHHTSVPGTQPWLLGVVNVRGTLVPLVDLRGYIEGGRTPLGDTSRMLVARHGSNAIGLLVEEVLGQRNLTAENDPLKLENDAANWARFVPAHFDLDGKLWGVFSMAALVSAPDFLHAAA